MRDYTTLRELVRSCGGNLIEEHVDSIAGGRAEAIFQGQTQGKFRFIWDGKKRCGFLQPEVVGAGAWVKSAVVRKPAGSNFSNLRQFLVAAENFAAGPH